MADFLLDTNVIIDFLRGQASVTQHMNNAFDEEFPLAICPVVYYEVMRGFKAVGASKQMQKFLQLYQDQKFANLPLDMDATEKAIEIYENLPRGVTIEDADIFIAAIAIVNECTLVTSNERHFSRVAGLNFVNWRLP